MLSRDNMYTLTEYQLVLVFKFGIIWNWLLFEFSITVVVKCLNVLIAFTKPYDNTCWNEYNRLCCPGPGVISPGVYLYFMYIWYIDINILMYIYILLFELSQFEMESVSWGRYRVRYKDETFRHQTLIEKRLISKNYWDKKNCSLIVIWGF